MTRASLLGGCVNFDGVADLSTTNEFPGCWMVVLSAAATHQRCRFVYHNTGCPKIFCISCVYN